MKRFLVRATFMLALVSTGPAHTQNALPSEIPKAFEADNSLFNYTKQTVMIPMRDGVKLCTVIWRLKQSSAPMPIVITRTPYDASSRSAYTHRPNSPTAAAAVPLPDAPLLENGYIRVYQDVRGKYGSEGTYVMGLPLRGPANSGPVDQATDAWDTIDWLVKNVPNNNGRVGIIGVSYEGWTALMALFNPHPALKASIPMNAMVDGWIGDDWYHNGAFRQFALEYIYRQTTAQGASEFPFGSRDAYAAYLKAGSANEMMRLRNADQLPAWKKIVDHPEYDDFWKAQAVDKLLLKTKLTVPTLTVHGLYDQEDIYGPIASYEAMEKSDTGNDRNYLVIGPWFHGQQDPWFHDHSGTHLGPIPWDSDTTKYFLQEAMLPFFEEHLKGHKPASPTPPVRAFETGRNVWQTYSSWPPPKTTVAKLFLRERGALSFTASADKKPLAEYVSDPAKPVPYRVPPIVPNDAAGSSWGQWLVDDQRPFNSRPDVITYMSEPLDAPLTISGAVTAEIVASTTGTDSDWVVKLIDAFPDEYPADATLGGYQLMISADIMRGRYRESLETSKPIKPSTPAAYRVRMPHASHTFRRGHRIVVQVQSSWFPLYDRNPQTFVKNIAYAPPESYQKATQRIYPGSFVELPVREKTQ